MVELAFEMSFSLWGNGGPNWRREEALFFYKESDAEWTVVGRKGKAIVPVSIDRRNLSPARANRSVFQRLSRAVDAVRDLSQQVNGNIQNAVNESVMEGQEHSSEFNGNSRTLECACFSCGEVGHIAHFCRRSRLTGFGRSCL